VRQHQEVVSLDAVDNCHCRLLDRQYAGNRAGARCFVETGHRGGDVLRTDDRDADAAVAVCNRKRLREGHGPVLGHAVGGVAGLAQQSCSRCDADQVTGTALEHTGQHGPARMHVRHHVDFPHALPPGIRLRQCVVQVQRLDTETRVRHQDVHPPESLDGGCDQRADRGAIRHVALHAESAEFPRRGCRQTAIEVPDRDALGATPKQLTAQCPPYPPACTGDERDLSRDLHADAVKYWPSSILAM